MSFLIKKRRENIEEKNRNFEYLFAYMYVPQIWTICNGQRWLIVAWVSKGWKLSNWEKYENNESYILVYRKMFIDSVFSANEALVGNYLFPRIIQSNLNILQKYLIKTLD